MLRQLVFKLFFCVLTTVLVGQVTKKRLTLDEHHLKALQEGMKLVKQDLRNIRKKLKRQNSEAVKHVSNVKTTSSVSVTPPPSATQNKPATAEAELSGSTGPPRNESNDNGNTAQKSFSLAQFWGKSL